ncbi:PREDICTED: zinc finger MYM-type protein 1-like [Vollenhovia emeryi]|uniref:zinc finger MYM-type protein 1-like n=1 Tax=Vollenhovia emeryi TaxID=411798 RepID=UPI0005F4E13C|nr:PREDICTED: zinc finger MYM-type protein 1-like [Vollenhovia emeryi]
MERFVVRGVRGKRANDETDDSSSIERQAETQQSASASDLTSKVIDSVAQKSAAHSEVPQVYQRWKLNNPWLGLNELDQIICTICTEACNKKLVIYFTSYDLRSKETWVDNGFGNWKHGAERIKNHSKGSLHINCAEILKNCGKVNVVQHLSTSLQNTLRILGRQGLAIRGTGNDENSNFMTILKARADVVELESWLKRTGHKWLHHDVQDEIVQAMATEIMLGNICEIKNSEYFSVLLDETADIARTDKYYTKAQTLFDIVKDVLVRFDLPLCKLRGQCYDGAANVSGKISGLQQRIQDEEPRALFVHCNAHNLNLVVQDGIEKVLEARKFIGEVKDMINFVRDSPKRFSKFQNLQAAEKEENEKDVPALVAYCPTRWVVRIKSLKTVLANYKMLMSFFQELIKDREVDSTIVAKASRFLERMESFKFLFLLNMMVEIFDRIEILNRDLQNSELCVVDSCRKIEDVTYSLDASRDSNRFDTDSAKFFKTLERFVVGEAVDVKKIVTFYKGDFDEFRLGSDKDMALSIMKRKGKNPQSLKDVVEFMRERDWVILL